MSFTLKEVAKMIDHSLLHPTMTDQELIDGCKLALAYDVAAVCIKPYFVKETARILKGSTVEVCSVIGFPHGNNTTKLKVLETRQACEDGATEIDMVVNAGKVLGRDWEYVSSEIRAINDECQSHGAILKVIFENDFLPEDSFKIKLCEISTEVGVAFIKTSTGYGFVKGEDGKYSYQGATDHDLKLMRKHAGEAVQIKAAGGVRTLDGLLKVRELGCSRLGASATVSILEEAKKRLGLTPEDGNQPTVHQDSGIIQAAQKDEKLVQSIESTLPDHTLRIWWLGQSGFLIRWKDKRVLFDPYLSDSLTDKYAQTEKPHVRIGEKVIDPAFLTNINLVTSSHNHTDHLDAETLLPLFQSNPQASLVIPEANRNFVANRLNCRLDFPIGLDDSIFVEFSDEFRLTGLASAHNELETDEHGHHKFLGFMLEIGPFTLYHSGDTLWYEGLDKKVAEFKPDLLFLPINGNKPERKVAGNMSAEEAAAFGKAVGSGTVIPHHFHMFEFNTEDPENFQKQAKKEGIDFKILKLGESFELTK